MNYKVSRAQPPLEFISPSFNYLVLQMAQLILPLWISLRTNICQIEGEHVEDLAELYHQFQQGKIRFLMAFRHPHTNDPLCMAHLVWRLVPQMARQKKLPLRYPVHSHFIYDRGIPLWAGSWVGWLYSRLGGTPIQRGKLDLIGLRAARHLFANGHFPMAAAPEGATNGHNEIVSPLEPGIAQLSFWCVEDLAEAERTEQVIIVPIGIQYRYLTPPWQSLDKLLTQLESDSGLTSPTDSMSAIATQPDEQDALEHQYERLYRLGEHLLSLMEEFYRECYHQHLTQSIVSSDSSEKLSERLHNLLDTALRVAEEFFDLKPKGTFIDRCRRLEQAGWDQIYRELKPKQSSTVQRGLADLVAEEASLRMWHMRIVESFVAVTGHYVREKPTVERFAETSLLLWDLVARIKGENPFRRPQLGKQRAQITIGEPISVSERWHDYQTNRRRAVANLTKELQTALERAVATE